MMLPTPDDRSGDHEREGQSASICTCWTSFVVRVMSDGVPKWPTSRCGELLHPCRTGQPGDRGRRPSLCGRRSRRRRRAKHLRQRDDEHQPAGTEDVAGVPLHDAVVDDVGVQRRQVQRGKCREELEDDDSRDRPAVGPEIGTQQSDQHVVLLVAVRLTVRRRDPFGE